LASLGLLLLAVHLLLLVFLVVVALEPVLELVELLVALANVGHVLDGAVLALALGVLLIVLVDALVQVHVALALALALHGVEHLLPDGLADVEGLVAVGALAQALYQLALD